MRDGVSRSISYVFVDERFSSWLIDENERVNDVLGLDNNLP